MSWFLVVLLLNLTFSSFSEASHDKKLLPSVVVGTVYCDTCFQHDFPRSSHFIAGASVGVECKVGNSKPRFWKEVRTNEHGEFKVELPFSVSKHVRRIKGCTVKLIKSSEPHCSVASAATSSSLSLKSRNQREHTFSAGFFSFKPLQQPDLCNHNPGSVQNSKEFDSEKTVFPPNLLPPPLQDPTTPIGLPTLPPLPEVPVLPPLPKLPPLPPVIGIPLPPVPKQAQESKKPQFSDQKVVHPDLFFPPIPFLPPPLIPNPFQPPPLIPNPFQPPPLIPNPFQPPPLIPNPFQPPSPPPLIPNPFQPPSPPPLIPNPFQPPPSSPPPLIPNPFQPPPSSPPPLIPNPFQPPPPRPSPLFPFPPIPGLTPSPPPPPPAAPFLPFPFPPIPGLTPSPPPSPPPPPPPVLPFPFPPLFPPRSPGNPPASSSKITSP